MATDPTDAKHPRSDQMDRISDLSDELLFIILSLLPTRTAARTSVLSRRFRHLWEASTSLDLIFRDLPKPKENNFCALADRLLFHRNPHHPLLSLHLEISGYLTFDDDYVDSLLAKVVSLDLRHLTIECLFTHIESFLTDIFSIKSLESLSLPSLAYSWLCHEYKDEDEDEDEDEYSDEVKDKEYYTLPSASLPRLTSLSIQKYEVFETQFNQFLSELPSLQYLYLGISMIGYLTLSSQTIKTLKLVIFPSNLRLGSLELSFPLLESLHIETRGAIQLPEFPGEIPSLKKVVLYIDFVREEDDDAVDGLSDCVLHDEELMQRIRESEHEMDPFCILWDSDKDQLNFPKLEHLDVSLYFYEDNFEAVISLLHHCPALESVEVIHKLFNFTDHRSQKTKSDWKPKLPHYADHNYLYAYFRNLHSRENRSKFLQLLGKKSTSKRHAHGALTQVKPAPLLYC